MRGGDGGPQQGPPRLKCQRVVEVGLLPEGHPEKGLWPPWRGSGLWSSQSELRIVWDVNF